MVEIGGGGHSGPDDNWCVLDGIIGRDDVDIECGEGESGQGELVAPAGCVATGERRGRHQPHYKHVEQMREERIEREVVEDVSSDMVERAELALRQRLRSKPQVYLPRHDSRKLRLQCLIRRCQGILRPESSQSSKDNIGRGGNARAGLREDVRTRSSGVKRQTEEQEEGDREKEHI